MSNTSSPSPVSNPYDRGGLLLLASIPAAVLIILGILLAIPSPPTPIKPRPVRSAYENPLVQQDINRRRKQVGLPKLSTFDFMDLASEDKSRKATR